MPARRLLRAVSTGATDGAPAQDDSASEDDDDLLSPVPETQFTHILDQTPIVRRVFAFTEYPHPFTVSKTRWIIGPPPNPNAARTDFYLTMISSSDGQLGRLPSSPSVLTFLRPTW